MPEKVIELSSFGETLSSRDLGEEIRSILLHAIEMNDHPVEISFKNIFTISSSFADECFAKLVQGIGKDQFKQCFKITNLHDPLLRSILNKAVNKRLEKILIKK
jgi:hypothetical protein